MVEGKGSKNFSNVKSLIYNNPSLAHSVLTKLAEAVADYLSAKIEAGADAVQIFDTWGGILSQDDFEEFSLRYVEMIISNIKRKKEPVIFFPKGVHYKLKKISRCGADVIGLDWTMNIGKVRKEIGEKVALQGNLDPTVLYATEEKIKEEAIKILSSYRQRKWTYFQSRSRYFTGCKSRKSKIFSENRKGRKQEISLVKN